MERILKAGNLAYLDSFAGLVPCRVQAITEGQYSREVTIVLTAARPGYKRGETINTLVSHVVPRNAIRRRRYSTSILPYTSVIG